MLRVYVSDHCAACATARQRLAQFRTRYPQIPAQLIEVDTPGAAVPVGIIGTPIYTWRGRVVFRGNPSAEELAALPGGAGGR